MHMKKPPPRRSNINSARTLTVIEVCSVIGLGEGEIAREVLEYFTLDGELLARHDMRNDDFSPFTREGIKQGRGSTSIKWSGTASSVSTIVKWLNGLTTEYEIVQSQIVTERRFQRIKNKDRRLPEAYHCIALVIRRNVGPYNIVQAEPS